MSKKDEPIRHVNKTAQDKMPVAERPRVKAHNLRIVNMRLAAGHTLTIIEED